MYRIFNCGIGMVLIIREEDSEPLRKEITKHNFKSFIITKPHAQKTVNET